MRHLRNIITQNDLSVKLEKTLLPLFPYNGILRPAIMLAGTIAGFAVLKRMQKSVHYRKLLFAACLAYLLFLIYATFLSRSVAQTYSYRLELMGSARQAFSVKGGLWSLVRGDFSTIRLDDSQSLEAIAVNLLLMVPVGYLSPMVCSIRGKEIRAWQAILAGSMLSALVEVIQLITWLGMLDVDDWVFNTVGTAAGYLLYRLFFRPNQKI